jgi:hypothetical protein
MSMTDCVKCWNTPCICGWGYKGWSIESLKSLRDILNSLIQEKEAASAAERKRATDLPNERISWLEGEKI